LHSNSYAGVVRQQAQELRSQHAPSNKAIECMVLQLGKVTQAAALAQFLGVVACAEVIGIADDPRLQESPTGPWRCLATPNEPAPPIADHATVRVLTCNFVSTNCGEVVSDLTAKLCDKLDVGCMNPIQSDIPNDAGEFVFDVATGGALGTGFDGYLQISSSSAPCVDEASFGAAGSALCATAPGCHPAAPDEACDIPVYMPALLFFNPPIRADSETPRVLPLVPTSAILPLAQAAGTGLDLSGGSAFIAAVDCDGRPVSGVQLSTEQAVAAVMYLDAGVISTSATETDDSGLVGLVGMPAGFAGVHGSIADPNDERERIEIGEVGLRIAPFSVSYATLAPSR
jgi:hypothetical protein